MAELAQDDGGGGKGKKRPKKGSSRIDMTPMVDLGFLLLTFFVLTSTFAKPKVMSLTYPAKDPEIEENKPKDEQLVNEAITFLLTKDRIFYYEGAFHAKNNTDGATPTQLSETDFGPDGVRKLLAEKNTFVLRKKADLDDKVRRKQMADTTYKRELRAIKGHKDALKVLVKTDDKALTRNFIDLIDELYIGNIGVIAPVDIMKSEQELIDEKLK